MATIDANIHLADYYFSMLDSLSRKAKLYLVKRLTDSLLGTTEATVTDTEAEKDKSFHNLGGIWTDDPEAEQMENMIENSRTSNHTRYLISLQHGNERIRNI